MRVLWLVRADLERHSGGDTVQIFETARALRARGCEVVLSSEARPSFAGYDLVHLFHLDRLWENLPHAERLAAERRPMVLSTIWWPTREFDARGRDRLQGALARVLGPRRYSDVRLLQRSSAAWLLDGKRGRRPMLSFRRAVARLLERAHVLLPNSRAEMDALRDGFGARNACEVVPNAADARFFHPPPPGIRRERKVVCVGRIEPRKNQLALIEAVSESALPLELVGRAGRFHASYAGRCRRAAGPNVTFTGELDRAALRQRLWTAAVHVAPSWYETPGLASLEAALCGARLVVTPGGCTREYFGEHARTCLPDDPASIAAAVEDALAGPERPELGARLAREFTWERAAEATERGYERALALASPGSQSQLGSVARSSAQRRRPARAPALERPRAFAHRAPATEPDVRGHDPRRSLEQ